MATSVLASVNHVDDMIQFKKTKRAGTKARKASSEEKEKEEKNNHELTLYQKTKPKVYQAIFKKSGRKPVLCRGKVRNLVNDAIAEYIAENPQEVPDGKVSWASEAIDSIRDAAEQYSDALHIGALRESSYRPSSIGGCINGNDVVKAQAALFNHTGLFQSDISAIDQALEHFDREKAEQEQQEDEAAADA